MKKLLLIMAAFCLTLINLQAAAIEDKDFEQFFKEFQKELSQSDNWYFQDYYARLLSENIHYSSDGTLNDYNSVINDLLSFFTTINRNKKFVLKLNKKNNYEVIVAKEVYKKRSYITTLDITPYELENSNATAYCLSFNYPESEDGGGGTTACVFAKLKTPYSENGEWKIIKFILAG